MGPDSGLSPRVEEAEPGERVDSVGAQRELVESAEVAPPEGAPEIAHQLLRDALRGGQADPPQVLRLEAQVASAHLDRIGPHEEEGDPGAEQAAERLHVP